MEGFHRQVRNVTKAKGAFPSDMALMKLVFQDTKNLEKKWNQPLQNWSSIVQQLSIRFEGILQLDIGAIYYNIDRPIVRTPQVYMNGFVPHPPFTKPAN